MRKAVLGMSLDVIRFWMVAIRKVGTNENHGALQLVQRIISARHGKMLFECEAMGRTLINFHAYTAVRTAVEKDPSFALRE